MSELTKPKTEFEPTIQSLLESTAALPVVVLCGSNNAGKSIALKEFNKTIGAKAYHLQCQRFYSTQFFPTQQPNVNERQGQRQNYLDEYERGDQNSDQNHTDLIKIVNGLSNQQRQKLLDLCSELVEEEFTFEPSDPNNNQQPWTMLVSGTNISQTSTGTRLLVTVVGTLLDENYTTMMLDEPELGLTPKIQHALSSILFDDELRSKWFPHISKIFIATHSHLFLNRTHLKANFALEKEGDIVKFTQIKNISDLHHLQFNLLGNRLESLFLPSALVLVEGETDQFFLEQLFKHRFPGLSLPCISCQSDSAIKAKLHALKETMGDFEKSPYRNRIIIVLDSGNEVKITDFTRMGIPAENIHMWSKNGIEFYYPAAIMTQIFSGKVDDESLKETLKINDDRVTLNGITKTKRELNDEVLKNMMPELELDAEIIQLLNLLAGVVGEKIKEESKQKDKIHN